MRGLIITPYHRNFGGVEVMNEHLHRALAQQGIILDCLAAEDHLKEVHPWRLKIFGMPAASAHAYKQLKQHYDFVICNGEFAWGIDHPRCICLFHGTYAGLRKALKKQFSLKSSLVNKWLATIQRWGSRNKIVVTVSQYNRDLLAAEKINVDYVIDNPVDLSTYSPGAGLEGNGRSLFVGSYQHYAKGFDLLEKFADRGEKIDCVTNKIPAASLGYLGEVPRRDLPQLYKQYDCLIHPSRFESSCLVALEAMASGLPVLMNPVGIGVELQHHIPEFVISFDHTPMTEIQERINFLRANRQHFALLARSYVEKFHSFDLYQNRWKELILRVIPRNCHE